MKVRERSDTRLVLESFTWDIALVTGGLFGGPLAFVVIGFLSDGELLIPPLLVSALAAFLFAMFVGRRLVVFDTIENQIEIGFKSMLRKKLDVRKLSDLQSVKLTGSIGENEPKELDPNSLTSNRYRYTAELEFLEDSDLAISGTTMLFSHAPEIVRSVKDWISKSG